MKKLILVVDDNPVILKLLNSILTKEYEVVLKTSGIEALDWLEEGNFPLLIISDWMMPYFDGESFIHNLKISGFYKDTPVIVLSGKENLGDELTNLDFQIEGFLPKPFNPNNLKTLIEKVLKTQN